MERANDAARARHLHRRNEKMLAAEDKVRPFHRIDHLKRYCDARAFAASAEQELQTSPGAPRVVRVC